jgi:hypothetical protein
MAAEDNKGYVRETKWASVLRKSVGLDGQAMALADVMRIHNVPKRFATYWAEKAADRGFHAGELGGARNFLLDNHGQRAAEQQLWAYVAGNPMQRMTELARRLQNDGFPVDRR